MRKQFDNDNFQFGFELALGAAYRQGSDAGEVLATVDRISDGDSDSWVHEWTATSEKLQKRRLGGGVPRPPDQRAVVSPPSCDLLQHRTVLLLWGDRPFSRTRAGAVAPATGVVGASGRPGGRRARLDPLREDPVAGVLLSGSGCRARRAKATSRHEQRKRWRHIVDVGARVEPEPPSAATTG